MEKGTARGGKLAAGRVRACTSTGRLLLPRFLVRRVLPLAPAILLELQSVGAPRLLLGPVVPFPARGAFQPDVLTHQPAPALWPSGKAAGDLGSRVRRPSDRVAVRSLKDLGHDAGAHGLAPLADGEPEVLLHGDGGVQLDGHL